VNLNHTCTCAGAGRGPDDHGQPAAAPVSLGPIAGTSVAEGDRTRMKARPSFVIGLLGISLLPALPACSSPGCYLIPFGDRKSLILGTGATLVGGSTAAVMFPTVYQAGGFPDSHGCTVYSFDYSGTVEATGHGALTFEGSALIPDDDPSWLRGGLALFVHCDLGGATTRRDALDVVISKDGVEKYRDTFHLECARVTSFTLTTPPTPLHVGDSASVLPHVVLADDQNGYSGTFVPVDPAVISIDTPTVPEAYSFQVKALAPAQKPQIQLGTATATLPFDIIP